MAKEYSVIPLIREVLADYETPISVAHKLKNQEKFFLLESVEGGEKWGRYSILGMNISKEISINNGCAKIKDRNQELILPGNPIDALQTYLAALKIPKLEGLPRFFGGAVGYFSFESVRYFERCGEVKLSEDGFPDAYFMLTDQLAVFDNLNKSVKLISCVHVKDYPNLEEAFEQGKNTLDLIEKTVLDPKSTSPKYRKTLSKTGDPSTSVRFDSNLSQNQYQEMVRKAKRYIADGDIIQVVLAQHFKTKISSEYLDIYRALRFVNPSPYLFFLNLGDDHAIVGSSPEVMVRVTHGKAEVRPIAGTRPRGQNDVEDARLAHELLEDPKERAEHVMLVDLARNDLGRVANTGSVQIKEYMFIEKYSHVMHLVSQVESDIRTGLDALDVFKATFPAGTLSGAPKVRAMEIINELEPMRRGPYGGAIGYIGYGCEVMDMAITIRTLVMDADIATVTAGAGIVYDSIPTREFHETLHKSNGMLSALQLAENGLDLQ